MNLSVTSEASSMAWTLNKPPRRRRIAKLEEELIMPPNNFIPTCLEAVVIDSSWGWMRPIMMLVNDFPTIILMKD